MWGVRVIGPMHGWRWLEFGGKVFATTSPKHADAQAAMSWRSESGPWPKRYVARPFDDNQSK